MSLLVSAVQAFTSPQEGETEFQTHVNRILSAGEKETELDMYSSKNPNTTTRGYASCNFGFGNAERRKSDCRLQRQEVRTLIGRTS